MIQFHDRVQAGEDEATINLVTKLNTDARAEEKHHEQERDKKVKEKTTKTQKAFHLY